MDVVEQMPSSAGFTGLTRSVLEYSEAFVRLVEARKNGPLSDADWAPIERLVNVERFVRVGQFLGPKAEVIDWPKYRYYIGEYAGGTSWEGTLRHVTEQGNRVILELEERNSRDGVTDVSNTVTTYAFDEAGKLHHLEVYVMHLP